jgi:hypothetical protein
MNVRPAFTHFEQPIVVSSPQTTQSPKSPEASVVEVDEAIKAVDFQSSGM